MNDIVAYDEYKIFDSLIDTSRRLQKKHNCYPGVLGWVRVFLDNNLVHEGSNLVVAQGREFVGQKIFNITNYDTGNRFDLRPYTVTHFAVGSGGATVNGDQVVLNGPYVCDTGLYQPITLGNSVYLDEPSSFNGGDNLHVYTDAVKPITTGGSIVLESESYSDGSACTYYTKIKSVCSVPSGEPQVLNEGEAVEISEAGLYITSGSNVKMFAHICFAPKWCEKDSSLSIVWYTLC